jgi:hypothetical protein
VIAGHRGYALAAQQRSQEESRGHIDEWHEPTPVTLPIVRDDHLAIERSEHGPSPAVNILDVDHASDEAQAAAGCIPPSRRVDRDEIEGVRRVTRRVEHQPFAEYRWPNGPVRLKHGCSIAGVV